MVQYTEVSSENHKALCVIDRFKFSFHKRLRDGQQRFKGTNNTCKCYVMFDTDGSTVVDKTQGHEHKCDTLEGFLWHEGSNALKREGECLSEKPSKIICRALIEDSAMPSMFQTSSERHTTDLQEYVRSVRKYMFTIAPKNVAALHYTHL